MKDLNHCTGCGACVAACPMGALSMCTDAEGFYKPAVDESLCTDCAACAVDMCKAPKFQKHKETDTVYSYQCGDCDILIDSTSGGAFACLARQVLVEGGHVCGVVFDENMKAVHVLTDEYTVVKQMNGSKYIQSFIGQEVYREIQRKLDEGGKVLFSGTPCQVVGLRAYLAQEYENLLTVDFPCYGVPSANFFAKHIENYEKKYRGKIINFSFRDKKKNGFSHTTVFTVKKKNGKIVQHVVDDYRRIPYHYAFGKCDCFAPQCYECPYTTPNRVSDITLGSFWHIEKITDLYDVKKGVSMIIPNSEKGYRTTQAILVMGQNLMHCLREALNSNKGLVMSKKKPTYRDDIYLSLRMAGYKKTVKKYYRYHAWKSNFLVQKCVRVARRIMKLHR